jgi:hypothetical protein
LVNGVTFLSIILYFFGKFNIGAEIGEKTIKGRDRVPKGKIHVYRDIPLLDSMISHPHEADSSKGT